MTHVLLSDLTVAVLTLASDLLTHISPASKEDAVKQHCDVKLVWENAGEG